ncbi:MAG TPA: tetratricopeptide repeat protein [Bryobacteraceae bacterium]|nr:tetratricopeptide repeat protein [Bryobacteraceae bacterium]
MTDAAGDRLDSWKEIAAYLKRGTRTVQRWEAEEGLPVRRLQHDKLGSVYAYKKELDAWWASRRPAEERESLVGAESGASIAVLPFTDMSQEKDQGYFCEGMAEEIINALGRPNGLRVASRISSFQFRSSSAGTREIGRKLRVGTILEGGVRKSGNRLRITVQLTNAEDGYQLWSARYDREMSDVFAIQDEIAENVVQALKVTLSPGERAAREKAPTSDVQAYDLYLRGRHYFYHYGTRDIEFARNLFSRAIELDPHYVLAWAGLADCWSYLFLYAQRSDENRRQAEEASRRAVELDPESAQAQASRAVALSLSERNEEAEAAFEKAIRMDPALFEAHYFYARHCFVHGRVEEAVALYERAMQVRPEDYQVPLLMAQIYDDLGRWDVAAETRCRGVEKAEKHLEWNPDDARALYMAANGLVALGERERGLELAERALAMRPDEPMTLYNVGCIYSLLGRVEPAVHCLEKAVGNGLGQKGWFDHDSNLDPIRTHPRFARLMKKLA